MSRFFGLQINRIVAFVVLVAIFIYEVVLSSIKVLWWIYTKRSAVESEIFTLELHVEKLWQKITIAHFITLTPGTLTIEMLGNNQLLIHCLDRSSLPGTVDLVHKRLEPLLRKMEAKA